MAACTLRLRLASEDCVRFEAAWRVFLTRLDFLLGCDRERELRFFDGTRRTILVTVDLLFIVDEKVIQSDNIYCHLRQSTA